MVGFRTDYNSKGNKLNREIEFKYIISFFIFWLYVYVYSESHGLSQAIFILLFFAASLSKKVFFHETFPITYFYTIEEKEKLVKQITQKYFIYWSIKCH